jgi:arylformamidase
MTRIIDLSLPLVPGTRGVEADIARTLERDGWLARNWHVYSHAGTHMDAPIHYGVNDTTIDVIPLEQCTGPAWVVPCDDVGALGCLSLTHVEFIKEKLRPGDSLLFRNGWSRHAGTADYRDAQPRFSEELAQWCAGAQLRMVGVEMPAITNVGDRAELIRIHQIILEAGIIIVEGLTNLDQITWQPCTFQAFPIKLSEGDGAWVRAVAIEEDRD